MTRDQIQTAINEGIPFEIRMADGARYRVRERYQVWLYYYPTANHFLITAAHLREELARLRAELGPDPAQDEMVLIGHSQGGIIARLFEDPAFT